MSESTITLRIEGMTCGGCEASIARVLSSLAGVLSAEASHERGEVVLTIDAARAPKDGDLTAAVGRAGFRRVG